MGVIKVQNKAFKGIAFKEMSKKSHWQITIFSYYMYMYIYMHVCIYINAHVYMNVLQKYIFGEIFMQLYRYLQMFFITTFKCQMFTRCTFVHKSVSYMCSGKLSKAYRSLLCVNILYIHMCVWIYVYIQPAEHKRILLS